MKRYSLPAELWELDPLGFHLVVKARLNGTPIRMLVDTGANHSCFDRQFFTHLFGETCIQGSDPYNVGIGGNDFETVIATVPNLKICRIAIPPMEVRLLDLQQVNQMYNMVGFASVQGILGGDFLRRHRVTIDYENVKHDFYKEVEEQKGLKKKKHSPKI